MKKQLLMSTALATVGALAVAGPATAQKMSKPVLTLSGWDTQIIGFSDNHNPNAYNGHGNGFDAQSDSEIHFNGATTLDNGIKIQFRVELEGNTSSDQIDENWMRVSGSFGQLQVGSTDNAAEQMTTGYLGAWSTNVGQNVALDTGHWIQSPSTFSAKAANRVTTETDSEKINYFTPRFEGLQLGAAYIPGGKQDLNNTPASRDASAHGGYAFGANFVRKFGEVDFAIAGGYAAEEPKRSVVNGSTDLDKAWGGGIRVDFAGFRVAAGYIGRQDADSLATGHTKGSTWDAGIRYTFGPNAISLDGETVKHETSVGGPNDKIQLANVAFRRTLGPGVAWWLQGWWANYSGAASAGHLSNKGEALTTAIKVSF